MPLIIFAVCACISAVIVAVAVLRVSKSQDMSSSATTIEKVSPAKKKTGKQTVKPSAENDGEKSGSAEGQTSSNKLDIGNGETYRKLNRYLTNFTELWQGVGDGSEIRPLNFSSEHPYDASKLTEQDKHDLAAMVYWHIVSNGIDKQMANVTRNVKLDDEVYGYGFTRESFDRQCMRLLGSRSPMPI